MTLAKKLQQALLPFQDPEYAVWQTNYQRDQFQFLGVRKPTLQKVVKTLYQTHRSEDWKEDVRDLWNEKQREFHYAAIEWAIYSRKMAGAEDLEFYKSLVLSNSWWDTVDTIAPHLIGHLLLKHPELIIHSEGWLASESLWLRRTALLYQLRWKEKTDYVRLFEYCKHLSGEKEFFIRKAIGWALREYGKTNAVAVQQFLDSTTLSPLSKREASKNLSIIS